MISRGSISSSPKRTMACVWPPQISMMFHGRVVAAADGGGQAADGFGVAVFVEEFQGGGVRG